MKNTMTVCNGSSINADSIRIVVKSDEDKLFDQTYHYGYNVSWKKAYATEHKPFDTDLIGAVADEFDVKLEDVKYATGANVFKGTLGDL